MLFFYASKNYLQPQLLPNAGILTLYVFNTQHKPRQSKLLYMFLTHTLWVLDLTFSGMEVLST